MGVRELARQKITYSKWILPSTRMSLHCVLQQECIYTDIRGALIVVGAAVW